MKPASDWNAKAEVDAVYAAAAGGFPPGVRWVEMAQRAYEAGADAQDGGELESWIHTAKDAIADAERLRSAIREYCETHDYWPPVLQDAFKGSK